MNTKTLIASMMLATALIGCGGGTGNTNTGDGSGDGTSGGNSGSTEYTPYPDAPAISASEKQAFLDAVNKEREKGRYCGDTWYPAVPDLVWSNALYTAAYEHARDISETRHYTHDHSGSGTEYDWTATVLDLGRGSTVQERARNNGYVPSLGSWGAGENMGLRDSSLDRVVEGMYESPGHCANFMHPHMKLLGFAHYVRDDNDDGWVAVFAGE